MSRNKYWVSAYKFYHYEKSNAGLFFLLLIWFCCTGASYLGAGGTSRDLGLQWGQRGLGQRWVECWSLTLTSGKELPLAWSSSWLPLEAAALTRSSLLGFLPRNGKDSFWGIGWPLGKVSRNCWWGGEASRFICSSFCLLSWSSELTADLFLPPMMQLCLPASASLAHPWILNLQPFQALWETKDEALTIVAIPNRGRLESPSSMLLV